MIRRLWPRSRGAWILVVSVIAAFAILDVLVLAGSDFALLLLVTLTGTLVGVALAYPVTYPLRGRFTNSGMGRVIGIFLSFAIFFGILYGGAAVLGVPAFPTAESGYAGTALYGLAFGWGISAPRFLGVSSAWHGRSTGSGTDSRALAVVGGILAGLFVSLIAIYLLGVYVISPLIRYLAS